MLTHGVLVVKLARARVEALVAKRRRVRFNANRGVAMMQLPATDPRREKDWNGLAEETLTFACEAGLPKT